MNTLLDEISRCQNFYFWVDRETVLKEMEAAESKWQEEDQKRFDAEQNRIVAARERVGEGKEEAEEEEEDNRKRKRGPSSSSSAPPPVDPYLDVRHRSRNARSTSATGLT